MTGRFSGILDMFKEFGCFDIIAVPGRLLWGPASRGTSGKTRGISGTFDGATCSGGTRAETLAGLSPALGRVSLVLFRFFLLTFASIKSTFQESSLSSTHKGLEKVYYSAWSSISSIQFHGLECTRAFKAGKLHLVTVSVEKEGFRVLIFCSLVLHDPETNSVSTR